MATSASEAAHRLTPAGMGAEQAAYSPGLGAEQLPDGFRPPGDVQQRDGQQVVGGHRARRVLAQGAEADAREPLGRIEICRHRLAQARLGQGVPEPPGRAPDGESP